MARISGVELPPQKRIEIALRYIYGIGPTFANRILKATNVNPNTRVNKLSEAEVQRLANETKNYAIEGDLKQKILTEL